jgi:folate-binding protein YgfZ
VTSSPLLGYPGAVEADAPDSGVAGHYGQPMHEQRRLDAGSGWTDLSHRDVIRITGADRLSYLHAMTTQAFDGLQPGVWVEALLLSPQGHVEHGFNGVDDGETFVAHTEPGAGPALVAFLERMKFMLRVESRLEETLAVIGRRDGVELVDRSLLASLPDSYGAPSGLEAYEALRIAAGRARIGRDNDHRTIPNELGVIAADSSRAVHLSKGCYRGQETVARVHTLGRPPRRLTLLLLDGSADRLPGHGADVVLDGRAVGTVGSSARHHELGPVALALIKRNTRAEAVLVVDDVAAAQETVVDPDVGLHVRALR